MTMAIQMRYEHYLLHYQHAQHQEYYIREFPFQLVPPPQY